MRSKIKICGITKTKELFELDAAGIDYAGLWHGIPNGRHNLSMDQLTNLCHLRTKNTECVLVTMLQDISSIGSIIEKLSINAIQFHGFQLPGFIQKLKAQFGNTLNVFKVLHVKDNLCVEAGLIERYLEAGTDYLILDSYQDKHRIGSTGTSISNEFLEEFFSQGYPKDKIMIAGGINANNITDIDFMHQPFGFDIDTGARRKGNICADYVREITSCINHAPFGRTA